MLVHSRLDMDGGQVGIAVSGPLVSATASDVRTISDGLHAGGSVITLDLAGVSELDQPGLGALIALVRRARAQGRLVIVHSSQLVSAEMTRAGLPRLVEMT